MRPVIRTFIALLLCCSVAQAQVEVRNLQCESQIDPVAIDQKQPRFSWQLRSSSRGVQQTAYQIWIASSEKALNEQKADIWNSGKVSSPDAVLVAFKGATLQSNKTYYWKVKVFTNKGETEVSKTAKFGTAFLSAKEWRAQWIGIDSAFAWDSVTQWSRLSARYLRKDFNAVSKVKTARVYISGVGNYELYINGKKIGDQVLAPNPTDYRKKVLYNAFDVSADIKNGNNLVKVVLGNGRYFTMRQDFKPQKINTFGFPKLLFQLELEYENGKRQTIISDKSWKLTTDGPVRTNNEYDGEEYDARKEAVLDEMYKNANHKNWLNARIVAAPAGLLALQSNESMKVKQTIKPVAIKKLTSDRYILDMGQNFSGWLQLKVKGKTGDKVTLRFAESLQSNGDLYTANLRDAKVTDVYTLKGGPEEVWKPSFVYHGFRYVEVTGFPGEPTINNFEGQLVFDDLSTIGTFASSNATINTIVKNAWWGIASNYKGMPVDCPQRNERQPWLGDRATGSKGESFLFNNARLYAKWLDDIEESQTAEGAIPDVAPAFWNYYSDNMTWPGTYLLVADMLYRQFGDKESIVKHYPSMKKWMNYMQTKYMKNHIIGKDKYGDWCVPPESLEMIKSQDSTRTTRGDLIATAYFYKFLEMMQEFAVLSGQSGDVKAYQDLALQVKQAFNTRFYNREKKCYDNNTVTANLLPLHFGITPDSLADGVFNNIYTKIRIENKMHISTGVIGTQWLMRGLSEFQRSDIAYTLASNKTYPSWGYMAENGATTIWELWNGNTANPQMNSQNHVMLLGDYLIWLYENVAGIKSDDKQIAFRKLIMKPEIIDGLDNVSASYESPYGTIRSEWRKENEQNKFSWKISIPAGATAEIYIPANAAEAITESGRELEKAEGVKLIRMQVGYAVLEIGSGEYSFEVNNLFRKGIVKDEFIFERASFPESHASTIAETPEGLIAAWFGGTKEGTKDVCIWVSHLKGEEWSKPMQVADGVLNDSTRYACYNPVLYQVPNGELLLFYKIGPNVAGWTGWMMRSKDNGHTWSPREALPAGYLGPIKNKPVLIGNRLICPSSTEKNGWKVHFEITTDWGKTWTKTDSINDGKTFSAIQGSILTYADGSLQVLCRSRNMTVNESWSRDGGKTWSPMKASSLPNNNSGTDAVTLKDGRQLIVYNHAVPNSTWVNNKGPRTPLNVAVSKDGKNWEAALILEDSPVSQYSYPSVIQTSDGLVHFVYTWRRERIKHVVLDPSKLELKPIVDINWPMKTVSGGKTYDD
jgi:alpha-L-rhamnosidase